jgi:predicted ATP-binding protein involved in virulence
VCPFGRPPVNHFPYAHLSARCPFFRSSISLHALSRRVFTRHLVTGRMNGLFVRTHRAATPPLHTKKFREELITYFPLILHGPHRKRINWGKGHKHTHTHTHTHSKAISLASKICWYTQTKTWSHNFPFIFAKYENRLKTLLSRMIVRPGLGPTHSN